MAQKHQKLWNPMQKVKEINKMHIKHEFIRLLFDGFKSYHYLCII